MLINKIDKTILEPSDIKNISPDRESLKKVDEATARDLQLVVFDFDDKLAVNHIITTNNKPQQIYDYIAAHFPKNKIYYTDDEGLAICLDWYKMATMKQDQINNVYNYEQSVKWLEAEKLMIKHFEERNSLDEGYFINETIRLGFMAWASDLHRQSEKEWVQVRLRKDWLLKNIFLLSHDEYNKYILKIKYISGVKINIDYMPQDGRFDFQINNWWNTKKIDVRVSIMPWLRWQSVVMRYLDGNKSIMDYHEMWLSVENVDSISKNLQKNYGMILVTWPTGSGKTTTLYSMINHLNNANLKIITLEDPVEYEIVGIQQSQINPSKWYDFKDWLESVLRHDPDIILVWEIRDLETAEIAINAALTWHLVLSTLHTNSAVETIARLMNLWVKAHLLAPALNMIIGQRLLRTLNNKKLENTTNEDKLTLTDYIKSNHQYLPDFDIPIPEQLYYPDGEDGYAGRVAAMECLEIDDNIKKMILEWKLSIEILAEAKKAWFTDMRQDTINKILSGITTFEEYRRIL